MRQTVLLFAGLRDLVGAGSLTVELPAAGTVADLRRQLATDHPGIAALLEQSRVAVNLTFVSPDQVIARGDEVAVIPPVSGG